MIIEGFRKIFLEKFPSQESEESNPKLHVNIQLQKIPDM